MLRFAPNLIRNYEPLRDLEVGDFGKLHRAAHELDRHYDLLNARFPGSTSLPEVLHGQWKALGAVLGNITYLSDMTTLVLGCGAIFSLDRKELPGCAPSRAFEPWLPRFIHHLGGDVLGIDIMSNAGEKFAWLQRDLLQPGALSDLESLHYDLIVDSCFTAGCGGNRSPALRELCARQGRACEDVFQGFKHEAQRLLLPGGIYLCDEHAFVKRCGRLVPIGTLDDVLLERFLTAA
jgi:hypothetical protein